MKPRSLAAICVLAAALAGLAWWGLSRPAASREPGHTASPARPEPPAGWANPLAPGRPGSAAAAAGAAEPHEHAVEPGAAPAAEEARAAGAPAPPFSAVPYQQLRGWQAAEGRTLGLDLIVDPRLPTAALEQLARDALRQHAEAEVLAVNVYDSEEAATYDRHSDGGALAERHLVARARRHRALGVESIQVRGVEMQP